MSIIVKESVLHGLGVFACIDFAIGEVIERCPYLVIDDDDLQEINRLNDYLFTSPDNKNDYLCVLGCGMIYNHGAPANAEWHIDDWRLAIRNNPVVFRPSVTDVVFSL